MKNFFTLTSFSIVLLFALLSTVNMFSQTTHNISDPEALTGLSATLAAGDTVILADGIYTSEERIKFSPTTGTAAMPITFRPQMTYGIILLSDHFLQYAGQLFPVETTEGFGVFAVQGWQYQVVILQITHQASEKRFVHHGHIVGKDQVEFIGRLFQARVDTTQWTNPLHFVTNTSVTRFRKGSAAGADQHLIA